MRKLKWLVVIILFLILYGLFVFEKVKNQKLMGALDLANQYLEPCSKIINTNSELQ